MISSEIEQFEKYYIHIYIYNYIYIYIYVEKFKRMVTKSKKYL